MKHDFESYRVCMEEIKRRTSILDEALEPYRANGAVAVPNCELACLQLRKIYELIAFASLSANREKYARLRNSFERDWDINRITKIIENVNGDFLPVAIKEEPSTTPGVRFDLVDNEDRKFTRAELVKRHGMLSQMLHAANPYRKAPDYAHWLARATEWREELVAILGLHRVKVDPGKMLYRVAMSTGPEGAVQVAVLEREKS